MSRQDRSIVGWGAFVVAIAALCIALFGLGDSGSSSASGESGGEATAPAVIDVVLKEWAIEPSMIKVPADGATLRVINEGTMVHNLAIPSLGVKTPDLQAGESAEIEVAGAAGSYDALCEIAGHAASGMTAMLQIGDASMGAGETGGRMDWQVMDQMMKDVALKFPAATEGKGGQLLEPRLEDGWKVYDIVTSEVKWEIEPGVFVDAMAYNGVVPGPEIRVQVGDKVRVNLKNEMLESTDIHFHGVRVPNSMDGVDPYTQDAVPPGESFVYEFEAVEPAIGIYHSHHNAQEQVPNGLFGGFIIEHPDAAATGGAMPIPEYLQEKGYTKVDKEVTMVLNDAGTIGLSLNGKSFPATEAYTLRKGQVMMVHYMNEGLTAHPMHLHQPVGWVVAKDGTPLDFPMPGDTVNVAPGERYSVLYKATDEGVWAWHCHILTHAEGPEGFFGMVTALVVEN
jgi:FtsP/CotA-like multicopper oxidase with cupredoxin domain